MNRFFLLFCLLVLVIITSGCTTSPDGRAAAGGAVYSYSHTLADGSSCRVDITSARDVSGGAIEVGEDCSLRTQAESTSGIDGSLGVINELVKKIP